MSGRRQRAPPAAATRDVRLAGARTVAVAIGEAMHLLSAPLTALLFNLDVQRLMLERGRHADARVALDRVDAQTRRAVGLLRLLREWSVAVVASAAPGRDDWPAALATRSDVTLGSAGCGLPAPLAHAVDALARNALERGAARAELFADGDAGTLRLQVRGSGRTAPVAGADPDADRDGARLRLMLARALVEVCGGTLEVDPRDTTRATLVLPAAAAAPARDAG